VAGALAGLVLIFGGLAFLWSRPAIGADAAALAHVALPLTGGTIERVKATGPSGRPIPLALRDGRLWPQVVLAPSEAISIEVVLRRPGWLAWLAGSRASARLQLHTPSAVVLDRYLTLGERSQLRLAFDQPVRAVAYGQPEHLRRRVLERPRSEIRLSHTAEAGSIEVAAAPRTWESLPAPSLVSWFPAGTRTSAVLSPRPGTRISPATSIFVTFSKPVASALGGALPRLRPTAAGSWRVIESHTIVFRPRGYGFGLNTPVTLVLPRSVRLAGAQKDGSSSLASWTVPSGSVLRVQQILAQLGYLPLSFRSAGRVPSTAVAQESAAVNPPSGSFSWRYGDTPASLRGLWQAGIANVVTRGALMAFESAHELTTDREAGGAVWRALIDAASSNQRSTAGYSYVTVNEGSQSLALWHDGSVRLTTPVNTGIASRPTELGTFPVFEHIASGTMSGTNPDGSHYEDPGIPWISYFNGGDALHGFERASYGSPQSLGCVEMPPDTAGRVWPYTPIGTLVHVE
jgi:peptidoglycan hydrolase-like protein with peptidoglycan-binding domain